MQPFLATSILNNSSPERFLCGGFNLGATSGPEGNRQTKVCKPGPYQFVRIFDADVKIGNDGTDDDVLVGITPLILELSDPGY